VTAEPHDAIVIGLGDGFCLSTWLRRRGPTFTHLSYDDYRILHANLVRREEATIQDRIVAPQLVRLAISLGTRAVRPERPEPEGVPYALFIDPQLGRVIITYPQLGRVGITYPQLGRVDITYPQLGRVDIT
jgi:pyruvate/2-oxoglutarate dehydrogenase complex dihydrolipoamide dehydrogenase (E3) component